MVTFDVLLFSGKIRPTVTSYTKATLSAPGAEILVGRPLCVIDSAAYVSVDYNGVQCLVPEQAVRELQMRISLDILHEEVAVRRGLISSLEAGLAGLEAA